MIITHGGITICVFLMGTYVELDECGHKDICFSGAFKRLLSILVAWRAAMSIFFMSCPFSNILLPVSKKCRRKNKDYVVFVLQKSWVPFLGSSIWLNFRQRLYSSVLSADELFRQPWALSCHPPLYFFSQQKKLHGHASFFGCILLYPIIVRNSPLRIHE